MAEWRAPSGLLRRQAEHGAQAIAVVHRKGPKVLGTRRWQQRQAQLDWIAPSRDGDLIEETLASEDSRGIRDRAPRTRRHGRGGERERHVERRKPIRRVV